MSNSKNTIIAYSNLHVHAPQVKHSGLGADETWRNSAVFRDTIADWHIWEREDLGNGEWLIKNDHTNQYLGIGRWEWVYLNVSREDATKWNLIEGPKIEAEPSLHGDGQLYYIKPVGYANKYVTNSNAGVLKLGPESDRVLWRFATPHWVDVVEIGHWIIRSKETNGEITVSNDGTVIARNLGGWGRSGTAITIRRKEIGNGHDHCYKYFKVLETVEGRSNGESLLNDGDFGVLEASSDQFVDGNTTFYWLGWDYNEWDWPQTFAWGAGGRIKGGSMRVEAPLDGGTSVGAAVKCEQDPFSYTHAPSRDGEGEVSKATLDRRQQWELRRPPATSWAEWRER